MTPTHALPTRPLGRQQLLAAQARRCWEAGQQAGARQHWPQAEREYAQAVELAPREALYRLSLATALLHQGRPVEAQAPAREALALEPQNVIACRVLAKALRLCNRHADSAALMGGFTSPAPLPADFFLEHGESLLFAQRPAEAVPVFLKALSLDMHAAAGHQHLGVAFQLLDRPADAAICFETAAAVDKSGAVRTLALSQLVYELQRSCQWQDLALHETALLAALDASSDEFAAQVLPFSLIGVGGCTPAQQLRIGRLRSAVLARGLQPLPAPPRERQPGPLRLGFLSGDFYNHATALLVTELLELLDRERFEIHLYCHSRDDGSAIQQRLRATGVLHAVHALDDAALARQMRADAIDIAIDLKGHTKESRFQALACRPAPLQIAYLGYPASSGAPFIDYLIGDPVVTPGEHQAHYSECIAQLPHSYQPNDSRRALPLAPSRAELDLPEHAPVLVCFNQTTKITPAMADHWAEILRAVPEAVLWLLSWFPQAEANLRRELLARGVAPKQLVFAPKVSPEANLARLQCADLFLDTWPCNAHTTASEALWAGVPVLTVPGKTYASRVAASLVTACGQAEELVCADAESYVERAISLARDPQRLRGLQMALRERRLELPLFDSRRYARDFEALLGRMWARHEAGLTPALIEAAVD